MEDGGRRLALDPRAVGARGDVLERRDDRLETGRVGGWQVERPGVERPVGCDDAPLGTVGADEHRPRRGA